MSLLKMLRVLVGVDVAGSFGQAYTVVLQHC